MIINEDTLNQLIDWLKRKGMSSFGAHRILMAFYEAAMEGLEDGDALPLFNMQGFYFRKTEGEIEIYSLKGNYDLLFL